MKWSSNKKGLINCGLYSVCLDYDKDTYDYMKYFDRDDTADKEISFISPGFYKCNSRKECYIYAKKQPTYWREVRNPITNKLVV